MVTTIPIVGIAANDPVPGNLVAVQFAQGLASTGQTDYSAILIGNKLDTGYAQVDGYVFGANTLDVVDSESQVIDAFGAGSELHVGYRAFRAINTTTTLYLAPVAESAGLQAEGDIVFSGTATASGTVTAYIGTAVIDSGIVDGDTPSVIASNLADAINSLTYLPVTADANSGTVTLTAKQKGIRGNDIRFSAKIKPGSGVGTTVTPGDRTLLSGGTVADNLSNVLATIADSRYYYQVVAASDTTNLGKVSDQMDATAAPTVGLRQRAVAGYNGTSLNTCQTLAIAQNNPRVELVFQPESDLTPFELAANNAAVYSLFEQSLGAQSSLNFNSFGNDSATAPFWRIPSPLSGAKLSRAQLKSALNNGVTPINSNASGSTFLVRRITTRSLEGSNPDYRVRDTCKVTVSDAFADDLLIQANARFSGKTIADDPIKGQLPTTSSQVTPRQFKAMVIDLINSYANRGLLQDVEATKAGVVCIREPNPTTRISCRVPLKVVDIFNSSGTEINEVSQG